MPVTLKWANKRFYLTFFKIAPETKCVPYFFKAKNEEKLKRKKLFFLDQKPFGPFLENKKIRNSHTKKRI